MNCCQQCQGIEEEFSDKTAKSDLKRYRKKGADKTTRLLVDTLIAQGVPDMSLLDIGGGVGAIQHALLKAGVSHSTNLDASSAYMAACQAEAEQQGHADRITHIHGDFANMDNAPQADIVTLEKVICCYHDMPGLVNQACSKAQKNLGVVYPRDVWWSKLAIRYILNFFMKLKGSPFRTFVHSTQAINEIIQSYGFAETFHENKGVWQVYVFQKQA